MTISKTEQAFVDYVVELMQSIGPVHAKRMFGGHGLFLEDLMFALVVDSSLYLKADSTSRQEFIQRGLEVFSYQRQGKPCSLSYYQAPEEALEEYEAMQNWANLAYSAALRAARRKHNS